MPYPKTPAEEASQQRKIRNDIFKAGAYPYGERRLNPARKQTAYEYDEWTKTQQSHSINEGAYRDMLEAEERHLGKSSYPEGHPRREQAIRGYPELPQRPPRGPSEAGTGFSGTEGGVRSREGSGGRPEPVRPNRFRATCAHCGETVLPGEGARIREGDRFVDVHHPRCP